MKIAIVGGTESWQQAPFEDKEWKIWVIANQLPQYDQKRVDLIFEIHNDFSNRPEGYAEAIASHKFPMIVGEHYPVKADHIQVFDFEASAKLMDYGGKLNLTSTPAYMISHALTEYHLKGETVEEIGLFGIDMAVDDTEYFYEQPCVKEWMGLARGHGIKIFIPEGCPIGAPHYSEGITANSPEAFGPFSEENFLELATMHQEQIDAISEQRDALRYKMEAHGGAKQAYERMAKTARAATAGQEFKNLTQTVRIL